MDAKGEVLISDYGFLCAAGIIILSQNVKLGLQFRYQNGQVQVNHNHFLGYTKDADGNLIIDPELGIYRIIDPEHCRGGSRQHSSPANTKQNGGPAPSTKSTNQNTSTRPLNTGANVREDHFSSNI